jgi:hypothetical protein
MFRRILAVGGAALTAAALSIGNVGITAHADSDSGLSDVLVFVGQATINSDSDADTPAAVDLVGGSGTYVFNSTACEGWSGGGVPTSDPWEIGACGISVATSPFTNTVCGTGTAGGNATISSATGDNGSATFSINFDATVGVVTGTDSTAGPDDGGVPDTENVLGVVVLTAPANTQNTKNDTGDCTSGFTVVSAVTAR